MSRTGVVALLDRDETITLCWVSHTGVVAGVVVLVDDNETGTVHWNTMTYQYV